MELIERTLFLDLLKTRFENVQDGEGHCIFINGEAGIGKTSMVKFFCQQLKKDHNVYQGTCDALFTPRPLAPLYDILLQIRNGFPIDNPGMSDRTAFFTDFFHELKNQKEACVIVFEDIHWADEATLDFIKFLARRITQLRCLFILTYRDNEIHTQHPLRNVLGQLPSDSFTRIQLPPLSKQTVEKMAIEKGYNGEEVYSISGGNPFYVTEILASYSHGVPENIKDSILSIYNRSDEQTKQVWQMLSVLPKGLKIEYFEKIKPLSTDTVGRCLELKILIVKEGILFFKHELYRKTIEQSLSPFLRISLNSKILSLFKEDFERNDEIEQIIHHAKNANENDLVVRFAPVAARQAACVGAHTESAKLYISAIEYYQGNDMDTLIELYEGYAYECYLINRLKDAIIYTGKSLALWKTKNSTEKIGNSLRFLSRLWWLDGNRKNAENFSRQAIDVLSKQPSCPTKAMAFSNMSQLKMLTDQSAECITWGEKAITIARETGDQETLSHALNNVGSIQMNIACSKETGIANLEQSLALALQYSFHEHAARAYSNLGDNGVKMKNYTYAKNILDTGIQYCEERDLDSWRSNMLSLKAKLYLETGDWEKAYNIADALVKDENQSHASVIRSLIVLGTVRMRRGDADALPFLLEAEAKAFETIELRKIIPALTALLEYEWITGKTFIKTTHIEHTTAMIGQSIYHMANNEFAFWLYKTRKQPVLLIERYAGYEMTSIGKAQHASDLWKRSGCPYEQALALFEGTETDKKTALTIIQGLGATAVYEKMKLDMRGQGIKRIPRGIRKTTQSNPALLTGRELDVLQLLNEGIQNKEIAARLFISVKTVDHHISSILFKLDVKSRIKAVQEAQRLQIIK